MKKQNKTTKWRYTFNEEWIQPLAPQRSTANCTKPQESSGGWAFNVLENTSGEHFDNMALGISHSIIQWMTRSFPHRLFCPSTFTYLRTPSSLLPAQVMNMSTMTREDLELGNLLRIQDPVVTTEWELGSHGRHFESPPTPWVVPEEVFCSLSRG